MRVNKDHTLGEIKQIPELQEVKDILLINFPVLRDDMTLEEIGESAPRYDTGSMVMAVNRLLEIKESGLSLNLPMYTPEEIKAVPDKAGAALTFFPGEQGAPYVVLCSGGGYVLLTNLTEAFPTAAIMNERGYNVFIVTYRTGQTGLLPKPQDDLAAAVSYIETHADELGVQKGGYAVGGYSAGGHLAGSWGTEKYGFRKYGLPAPKALFLCYPGVIMSSLGDGTNEFFCALQRAVFGEPPMGDRTRYDLNLLIDGKYPATYIWHCKDDDEVPYETAVLLKMCIRDRCMSVLHAENSYQA